MSGHNKWSSIKHKKAITDAKRGKAFSRCSKEIIVAAKLGGGDPDGNPRLRIAISKAREVNMPKDNIEKSILKGTGELPGVTYEEVIMEAYGPGGVGILIEGLTDNKNRTSAELRSIINKNHGSSAGAGSVSYNFHKKGLIVLDSKSADQEKVMEIVLEAGADDMKEDGEQLLIWSEPQSFEAVKTALENAGINIETSEMTMVPGTTVPVTDSGEVAQLLRLLEAIEDCDDVQQVHANFDISDELMPSGD